MKKIIFICVLITTSLTACEKKPNYSYIEGKTMGTSYHIRFEMPTDGNKQQIQASIDKRLAEINKSMSTYDDTSTIMAFNRAKAGEQITIDPDFMQVMQDSKQVYQASQGAFNPTVMPLVELWGFGSKMTVERFNAPPTNEQIQQAKNLVDFDAVTITDNKISKSKDGIALDFSAVAKGYGVDVIANVLKNDYKIQNYMVEIGGEVSVLGKNDKGKAWQLGIDQPELNSEVKNRQIIAIISNPNFGSLNLATSGNYRNLLQIGNNVYSHTIDPTTGQPISTPLSSITVAHKTTSLADAWATALTAMPYEKALKIANDNQLAVLFVKEKQPRNNQQPSSKEDWEVVETVKMKELRAGK